jgi:acyl-coenzyme A thioesterase 7
MLPDDANPAGNVHGGTILKLIEQAGYIVSTRFLNGDGAAPGGPWHGVIVRLECMEFWQPMFVGEVSTLAATITYVSQRSIEVVVTVHAENVLTGNRTVTAP